MPACEDAAGQVLGFLVAGAIVLASFGALVWNMRSGADSAPSDQANQDMDASDLAAILVGDAGSGWASPDALVRLGLAGSNGTIHSEHLHLLNNETLDSLANGQVEYEEARGALGLAGTAGFRLRVVPLDYVQVLEQHDFSHMKALYIGDYGTMSKVTLAFGEGTIANANAALNASMTSNTGLERTVIDSIGVDFDNEMHLLVASPDVDVETSPVPGSTMDLLTYLGMTSYDGDVLYDNKDFLGDVLPGKLSTGGYDLLVLGSGIQHSTLTADSVKGSINTFVRGGGTLMVFGSPGSNFNWMQPIMDLSATSVSGAVTAPDPDHAMIALPYDLAWESYPTNNLAWTIGIPSDFENVLMQGGKPVLAISNDGAIGSGNVLLSSIQPKAVASTLGTQEAANFIFNMLLFDTDPVREPDIWFGPDPPTGMPVSSAVRTAVVDEDGVPMLVRIEVVAWGT